MDDYSAKPNIRGYFGLGVEGVSKPMNFGALLRTAHAFHASFAFGIACTFDAKEARLADTSDALGHLPVQLYDKVENFEMPLGCKLVGIEITPEAIDLPSFTHPPAAAYVLGAERDSLSPELQARCDYIIRIPTKFCINLAVAGAIVIYDRDDFSGKVRRTTCTCGRPPASHQDPPARNTIMEEKTELVGLNREELSKLMEEMGEPAFRAKQLWHWIYFRGERDFNQMTSLAKDFRQRLADHCQVGRPGVTMDQRSIDGTRKWLAAIPCTPTRRKWCISRRKIAGRSACHRRWVVRLIVGSAIQVHKNWCAIWTRRRSLAR